jgi:hypothetical protein
MVLARRKKKTVKQCGIPEIIFISSHRDDNFQSRMKHVVRGINDKQREQ